MTREELRKFEPLWDKWYIAEHLGGGSFGDVYRITCQVYERTYEAALKVISIPKDKAELNEVEMSCATKEETISYYDRIRQSITTEIDMMEQLKGKTNIVSFEDHDIIPHNHGKDPGYDIFIRMELLQDFGSVIGQESRQWTDNREIVRLGRDIAEGLRICHGHKIIHRDIKLSNIFRSPDGDYKIGDFGIARNVSDAQLTMSIKGTYNFMAPEVYNREYYDFRADIYSLGMVLYQLLNKNRGPFLPLDRVPTAEEKEQALIRRMKGEALAAPVYAKDALAAVILKACCYDKEQRYQSMEDFRQALQSLTDEDMERPETVAASAGTADVHAQPVVEREMEDDRTVAFVGRKESVAEKAAYKEAAYKESVYEKQEYEEDEYTVALPLPDEKEVPQEQPEQAAEPTKPRKKWIPVVVGIALVAVAAIGAGAAFANRPQEQPVVAQDTEDVPAAPEAEESDVVEPQANEPQTPDIQQPVKVTPVCTKDVAVVSKSNSNHLIFEGDAADTVKVRGTFQVSETDATEVQGELAIENLPEVFDQSADYDWEFVPEDDTQYETVRGTVHVSVVHRDLIDGLEELEKYPDKTAVYQLSLTDCGLKDLSILEGMTNLAVLVASDNDLTDISELANHPLLQQVYLDGNQHLKQITVLNDLPQLNIVDLDGTAVSDKAKSKLEKRLAE